MGKASRRKRERRETDQISPLPDTFDEGRKEKSYDAIVIDQDNRELLQRAALSALRGPLLRRR